MKSFGLFSTKSFAYMVVFVVCFVVLAPVYWMAITAFKPWGEIITVPPTFFPREPTLFNFVLGFITKSGLKSILDSTIISVGTLIVCFLLGIPAAYSLSRFRLFKDRLPFIILSFRFMPPIVISFAVYLLSTYLAVIDTHFLLICMNTLINLPFVVWLMKGFFDEVPLEIEEAGLMEGASRLLILRKIVLPLAAPGLVTSGLFAFVFAWNELLFATVLTDVSVYPYAKMIPGLRQGVLEPHWGGMSAMSIVVMIPIFFAAFYLQRYMVRGITFGAVK